MSLYEGRRTQKPLALDAPFDASHDDQVLTIFEWCQLNRFSESSGERIIKAGKGPKVTMLTERRRGVTIKHNREWQQARTRG